MKNKLLLDEMYPKTAMGRVKLVEKMFGIKVKNIFKNESLFKA